MFNIVWWQGSIAVAKPVLLYSADGGVQPVRSWACLLRETVTLFGRTSTRIGLRTAKSKRTGIRSIVTLAVLLLGVTSGDAHAQGRTTSGTAALDAQGTVVVKNHEGRITVETWDRDEVRYEAVVRPEDGADHPEATRVRVEEGSRRFEIRTEYDESRAEEDDDSGWFGIDVQQNIMPVAYRLTVPRGATVEVEDHESTIEVRGVEGELTVGTHEGSVTVADQEGATTLTSHDGPITVENQSGPLTIDTHDGSVRLRSVAGRTEINAHDGRIEAEGLRGALTVSTHEGEGRFAFADLVDDVEVDTHDGDFAFTLPAEAGFNLRTDFDDADLRGDFDLASVRVMDDDEINYAGAVNGGGPRLSLTAHDGSFEIRAP